jgi:hypothetical protein
MADVAIHQSPIRPSTQRSLAPPTTSSGTENLRARQLDRHTPRRLNLKLERTGTASSRPLRQRTGGKVTEGTGRLRLNGDGSARHDRSRNTSKDETGTEHTAESLSAGKTGRQYAVSNVGDGGRIYLRYALEGLRDPR